MLAKELISDIVPTVRTSDTGTQAISLMEDYRISHLPIVNMRDFLGLVSDSDIYGMEDQNEALGAASLSLFSPFVYDYQHIHEVVALVAKLKLTLVPVLNEDKEYLGSISMHDLVQQFAALMAADQPGGIIVLSMSSRDYSLSQIARLVEENDAKILNLFTSTAPDTTNLDVTIKLNIFDLAPIIRSFERYDYSIKASFRDDDKLGSLYRDRYEEFMRYLNI